jgi:RNA polymerase sigma-70 factor (ECF subfamily)
MAESAGESIASHHAEILRFVQRHSESRSVAEDVTQQVFLDAVIALERHGNNGNRLGLLYTIARRRLIDRLRVREHDTLPLEAADSVAESNDYGADLGRGISAAIDRLAPQQRQLIALSLLRGLTFAETAAIIGTSEAACKMRLRRALDVLRRDLEEKGFGT